MRQNTNMLCEPQVLCLLVPLLAETVVSTANILSAVSWSSLAAGVGSGCRCNRARNWHSMREALSWNVSMLQIKLKLILGSGHWVSHCRLANGIAKYVFEYNPWLLIFCEAIIEIRSFISLPTLIANRRSRATVSLSMNDRWFNVTWCSI